MYAEMKMAKKTTVKTKCYGEIREWESRDEAKDFFLEAMMNSDGSERDRYTAVYIQIQNGLPFCTDCEEEVENG